MWLALLVLLEGLLVFCCGVLSDRHLNRNARRSGMVVGMVGLTAEKSRDLPLPWIHPTAVALAAAGFCAFGLRLVWTGLRRGQDPDLDPARAAEDYEAGREGLTRFDRTGDVKALDASVDRLRSAVRASRGERARTEYAANLVMALRGRYERLREADDLDEAVETGREVAGSAPARAPRRGVLLSQTSCALRLRHDHFGDAADLTEALSVSREAVEAARHAEDRVSCLGELSAVLRSRFERERRADDLDEAIETLELAVRTTQARDRPFVRVVHLTTLCRLLVERYGRSGEWADLDRALTVGRQAAQRMPAEYRLYDTCLNNLALVLRVRYEHTPDAAELDEAVELARTAAENAPADDPARAGHQLNLALALHSRHRADGRADGLKAKDLKDAAAPARSAATSPVADVPARVAAGVAWGDIAAAAGEYAEAVTALEGVIELLPRLAARELRRPDQEHRLGQGAGIATGAAACALAAGQPEKAVALLEQGRGVLLGRVLDDRADLTALRHHHPSLAREFEALRDTRDTLDGAPEFGPLLGTGTVVDAAGTTDGEAESHPKDDGESGRDIPDMSPRIPAQAPDHVPDRETGRRTRRALAAQWDALLENIRAQPGFEAFARSPDVAALRATAADGPIVFLNVSPYRSDAIVLESSGVRTVPLPDVTLGAVDEQVRRTADAVRPEHLLDPAAQERFGEVLAWLWDAVAEPVTKALDLRPPTPGTDPARVWWVPTGPLTLLPIHAAGRHGSKGGAVSMTLLDRAVSSYVPTVRTLRAARARRSERSVPRPLVVALRDTPNAAPLNGAPAEADAVRAAFPRARVLAGSEADSRRVLAELSQRSWAHFACHAVTEPDRPSRGRLLLHDHERSSFSVADISRLRLRDAELAYLSSCSTARPGHRLYDEAIHLASSFQLAGFRQVIATLWLLDDHVGAEFATQVYEHLAAAPAGAGRAVDGATAVHRATLTARERYPNFPALWAGHIHVGP